MGNELVRNRLHHVNDAIASSVDSTDIDDIGAFTSAVNQLNTDNNYAYNAEGRLVKDVQEEIDTIIRMENNNLRRNFYENSITRTSICQIGIDNEVVMLVV